MGLGKTIQTIALMASTKAQHESEGRRSTLIVTPLALIQQWANEIRTKTQPGKLKVLVYHGSNRSKGMLYYDKKRVLINKVTLRSCYICQL